MKIEVIGKNENKFVGKTDSKGFCLFSSDEVEFIADDDFLFNSSGENGYFTSKSTGEEFISLKIIECGLTRKSALELL